MLSLPCLQLVMTPAALCAPGPESYFLFSSQVTTKARDLRSWEWDAPLNLLTSDAPPNMCHQGTGAQVCAFL